MQNYTFPQLLTYNYRIYYVNPFPRYWGDSASQPHILCQIVTFINAYRHVMLPGKYFCYFPVMDNQFPESGLFFTFCACPCLFRGPSARKERLPAYRKFSQKPLT